MSSPTVGVGVPRSGQPVGVRGYLRKAFSFPVFLAAVLSAGAFAITAAGNPNLPAGRLLTEGDVWWQVAVGERILSTHTWPTTDPFSFTVYGNPWMAYEWFANVVVALAARLGGLQGMAALLVVLWVTFVLLLYYYAWLRSGNFLAAAVTTAPLMCVTGAVLVALRAQLVGYIFLLVTFICLERFQQGRAKALWVLPGIFLVWVNTHGSFILGFLVLGLYWASGLVSFHAGNLVAERWTPAQRRHLSFIALLCVLAVTVTPYGTRLATYPLEYMSHVPIFLRVLSEWQPLRFPTLYGYLFVGLLLAAVVLQALSPIDYRLEILTLLLFTIAETCLHARFLVVFAIVFAPVLASLLARWLPSYRRAEDHPVLNAGLIAAIAWGIVAFFPSEAKLRQMLRREYPVAAVAYIRQNPVPAGMFNEIEWGGFLTWSLGPQHKVFIDGRGDIFEYGGVFEHYLRIAGYERSEALERDALPLLHQYRVTACLVHRAAPLSKQLGTSSDWKQVYSDDLSIIFVQGGQMPR